MEVSLPAHISCRPVIQPNDPDAGCFVVCAEHGLRRSFGTLHTVAHSACVEHNRRHHSPRPARSPKLLSVVYESIASERFSDSDFIELLGQARSRNSAYGVTGMLLAEDDWFLQVLEGPELVVEGLLRAIRDDPRHGHLRILTQETITERRFPDWAMAHGHIGEVEALPLEQYYEALLMARGQAD